MLGSHVKLAAIASIFALISAQVFAHFHAKGVAPKPDRQPRIAVSAPVPMQAAKLSGASGAMEYRIDADPQGQYFTTVEIAGARFRMLVDTGATSVALSYEDAAAAGIFPFPSDYKYAVSTANGVGRVARVTLSQVRVGSLVVRDVDAVVGERGALGASLLGMTFLSKLSKIESSRGTLVLRQ
jgi:aspartyl protease family protein